jgi:hypothetical protein
MVTRDCGHACCPVRMDEPHEHPPLDVPASCPDCIELAKAKRPTAGAQALEDRAATFAERFGRPDRNTRRDP